MVARREDVAVLARTRAGISDSSPELLSDVMEIAIDEASELILNYINRKDMPNGCKMVWSALAADIYRYNIKDFDLDSAASEDPDADADLMKNCSEIRIDDAIVRDEVTSAKYTADAISAKTKKEVDFLKNYRERLHRFRLMPWRKYDENLY